MEQKTHEGSGEVTELVVPLTVTQDFRVGVVREPIRETRTVVLNGVPSTYSIVGVMLLRGLLKVTVAVVENPSYRIVRGFQVEKAGEERVLVLFSFR